jgi:YegS/Rv2252/BmrU family lipid kinase
MQNSKRLVQMVGCLREHGILAGIDFKTSGKAVRELAKEAVDHGEELVIVAGGDGTIEDVASQLVGSKTTLGIIPTGTMNNLAHALGIPIKVEDAAALLGMGTARQIDVGRVVSKEKAEIEYFLEGAGIGLSAIVIPAGQAVEKQRWSLLPHAVRKLFDSKPESIQVELGDGQVIDAFSQVVTVSNSPLIGKHIMIAPDAKMDDGLLDIAIYEGMGKTDLLRHFTSASKGKRVQDPKVKFYKSKSVRIRSTKALGANSDKDEISAKRVFEIELMPHALSVIVGNGIGLSLPVEAAPDVLPVANAQDAKEEKQPTATATVK